MFLYRPHEDEMNSGTAPQPVMCKYVSVELPYFSVGQSSAKIPILPSLSTILLYVIMTINRSGNPIILFVYLNVNYKCACAYSKLDQGHLNLLL